MLIAIAAMAFLAAIIAINGNDDDDEETIPDEIIEDEELIDENGLTPWGPVSEEPTLGDDILIGDDGDDSIFAKSGDDTVAGQDGDDRLFGNGGIDYLIGGNGDDFERGGLGSDILVGGPGNDHLIGDASGDLLVGNDGDDTISGGTGDDFLIGNSGQDHLTGGSGDDALFGNDARTDPLDDEDFTLAQDELRAGIPVTLWDNWYLSRDDDGAADTLDGGDGNDYLFVNDGDTAIGGNGADQFYLLDDDESNETALIADFNVTEDVLLYVHDEGTAQPALTLVDNNNGSQTLFADGAPVSVIVSAGLNLNDIFYFSRFVPPA